MIIGAVLIVIGKSVTGYIALFLPGLFQAGNYIYVRDFERKIPLDKVQQEGEKFKE